MINNSQNDFRNKDIISFSKPFGVISSKNIIRIQPNIFVSILVVSIFSLHPSLNKGDSPIIMLHYYVYGNNFDLSLSDVEDQNAVKVRWSCENNDGDSKDLIIYENGKVINDIPFEKGAQRLTVYYNDQLIGTLDQDKLKKLHAHQYKIRVSADEDKIKCVGNIYGPAPGESTQSFDLRELILAAN